MTIALCKSHCGIIYVLGDSAPQLTRMKINLFTCKCSAKQFDTFKYSSDKDLDKTINLLSNVPPKKIKVITFLDSRVLQ